MDHVKCKKERIEVSRQNLLPSVSKPKENLEEVGYIGLLNAVNLYGKNIHRVDLKPNMGGFR